QTQGEITGRLSRAEQQARDKLKGHQRAVSEAEAALKRLDGEIVRLGEERTGLIEQSTSQEAELKALAEKVAGEASASPEYASKRQAADELVHVAEESMRKTEQAEADQQAKG